MVSVGGEFAPGARAARAYHKISKVYAALTTFLTTFTDPLFRSMADGLQGLERAGPAIASTGTGGQQRTREFPAFPAQTADISRRRR